jgi:hypothetical protein
MGILKKKSDHVDGSVLETQHLADFPYGFCVKSQFVVWQKCNRVAESAWSLVL